MGASSARVDLVALVGPYNGQPVSWFLLWLRADLRQRRKMPILSGHLSVQNAHVVFMCLLLSFQALVASFLGPQGLSEATLAHP